MVGSVANEIFFRQIDVGLQTVKEAWHIHDAEMVMLRARQLNFQNIV